MAAANERYEKRYDSVGTFLDYWTFGIPKGMWQGYADRADTWLDSPEDFANWATLGVHGTIRETIFPKNAWSTEHWANILGTAGLVGGSTIASTIKPKNYFGASTKAVAEVTERVKRDEIVAPVSGKAIKVYTDGNTRVPIDKIEKYMRGKVNVNIEEVNKKIRELNQMKQTQRKLFDADPQNAKGIEKLKQMKHNYERSQDMKKKLETIGLNDIVENNEKIAAHFIEVGKKITPENRLDFPSVIEGPHGKLKVLTTWTMVEGKPYLATIKLIPIKNQEG
ncbi:hypothetical protein [Paenibacillus jiagnxiensis]|uniref:hypothetical protein n=1 Tax=Paenibacillus jiagnxiensis TaxID=3228926 RepID=UPI0038D365E3